MNSIPIVVIDTDDMNSGRKIMQKNWYKKYAYLMYRTRYVGIVVSVIIVLLAILGIWNTIDLTYKMGSEVSPELAFHIKRTFAGDIFVGVVFAIRGMALWNFKKLRYPVLIILFWICVAGVFTDIYLDLPFSSGGHCNGEGVCYAIYDISTVTNPLNFAGSMFVVGSFVRIAITSILAVFRFRNNELNSYS